MHYLSFENLIEQIPPFSRVCIGMMTPPPEEEKWFCSTCIAKRIERRKKKKKNLDIVEF